MPVFHGLFFYSEINQNNLKKEKKLELIFIYLILVSSYKSN